MNPSGERLTTRGRKSAEIVRLAMAGVPRAEIVQRVGTTRRSILVVLCAARKMGLEIPKAPAGRPATRRGQIADMAARGLPPRIMAETLGISKNNAQVQVTRLRSAGVDVPYRRPPTAAFWAAVANRPPRREWSWEQRLTKHWHPKRAPASQPVPASTQPAA